MTIDIYTDARSENISKRFLRKNPNVKQIEMQVASIIVDDNEIEYHFVEKTTVIKVKNKWKEFSDIEFKVNSTIAEMYSIYAGLIQSIYINKPITQINLYTDSEQSYKFINGVSKMPDGDVGFKPHVPKCPLTKKINNDIQIFIKCLKNANIKVDIRWIKGHDACYYNNQVDKLCKTKS